MESMRALNTGAAEAVLAECIAPQPSTEEAAIPHMLVLAEAGHMFSNQQLTELTPVFKLHSLNSAFSMAFKGRSNLSVGASMMPPPLVEWSCSGVVVWIGEARERKFGRRCVLVKLNDLRTELVTLFVGDAADAFLGGCGKYPGRGGRLQGPLFMIISGFAQHPQHLISDCVVRWIGGTLPTKYLDLRFSARFPAAGHHHKPTWHPRDGKYREADCWGRGL